MNERRHILGRVALPAAISLLLAAAWPALASSPQVRNIAVSLEWSEFAESKRVQQQASESAEEQEPRTTYLSSPITVPLSTPEPFVAVTATWRFEGEPGDIAVALRGSPDGSSWNGWYPIVSDGDASTRDEWVGALQFLSKQTHQVQFRIELSSGSTISRLSGFRAVFISPGASQSITGKPSLRPRPRDTSKPPVVTRTEWGCPDGQESPGWTPQKTEVTHLIVHHTVNSNTLTDWPAVVRSIFSLHTYTNGWGDIGYNFLIDPSGVIYEGRAGGDDIKGAHFSCANSNTMGMAFLGTFTSVTPTDEAMVSARHLLAWKAEQREIDPLGIAYHPPTALQLHTISGHRDANPSTAPGACPKGTECPGNELYPMLPILRLDVSDLLTPAPGLEIVSPNGGEIWAVGRAYTIRWNAAELDPSGQITIRLSLDGGDTSESLGTVDASATSFVWTPGPEHMTASAQIYVGCLVEGEIQAEDWSDLDFAITTRSRQRPTRRPTDLDPGNLQDFSRPD